MGRGFAGKHPRKRGSVRFNDMLATLLAQPQNSEAECIAVWRQLVDLVAQGRFSEDQLLGFRAAECISHLRSRVPSDVRARTARTFAGQPVSETLILLFSEEPAPVLAPLIRAARLTAEQWLRLLPRLTPVARSILRHRDDLAPEVHRALESFGASDFVIAAGDPVALADEEVPAGSIASPETVDAIGSALDRLAILANGAPAVVSKPVEAVAQDEVAEPAIELAAEPASNPASGDVPIRDLMARIETYQGHDIVSRAAPSASIEPLDEDDGFCFEAGADGAIIWVTGTMRGPLIGENIGFTAPGADHGVDGHAAGAFRSRAPFRDARLTIAGTTARAGEWRISGVPVFDQLDGRFLGYRGTARRPRPEEIAVPAPVSESVNTADSLRQLVHELRTPLTAIIGFSEVIESQFLGPASLSYRERAGEIRRQGRRLLAALEDLDITARIDRSPVEAVEIDPIALIERLYGGYEAIADARGYQLKFRIEPELGLVAADPAAVERMVYRMLTAVLGVAQRGETIAIDLVTDPATPSRIMLSVQRPVMLMGRDEPTLLDPGYNPDGAAPSGGSDDLTDGPALGLGFALRLVRNIASACGGSLDIEPERLILRLPLSGVSVRSSSDRKA